MPTRAPFIFIALLIAASSIPASGLQAQDKFQVYIHKQPEVVVRGNAQFVDGNAIECGAAFTKCAADFPANTTVILNTEIVKAGYVWRGWFANCANQKSTRCVVVMKHHEIMTPQTEYIGVATIRTAKNIIHGNVTGRSSAIARNNNVISCPGRLNNCSYSATPGTRMLLFPTGDVGYKWTGTWTGVCVGQGYECNVTMKGEQEVGATFEAVPIRYTVEAPAHSAIKNGTNNCRGECQYTASAQSTQTFELVPDAGYMLEAWTRDCIGQKRLICTVKITSNHHIVSARVGPR